MQWILFNSNPRLRLRPGDCAAGCLFNVEDDPAESVDLSHDPAQKEPTSCAVVSGASCIATFQSHGQPEQLDGLEWKLIIKMDDFGVPRFRKPPYGNFKPQFGEDEMIQWLHIFAYCDCVFERHGELNATTRQCTTIIGPSNCSSTISRFGCEQVS